MTSSVGKPIQWKRSEGKCQWLNKNNISLDGLRDKNTETQQSR